MDTAPEWLAGARLAVIGDSMVDRFLWGSVDRISPEAPVPVVKLRSETVKLGGVDMTTSKPMEDVIALFGSLIDQTEELLES